ncbi:SPOR domain-containing protein [Geobacter sp. SVR]|uniref:SPOR domain-containing protein n=1 Tax=Geobacter sp. SVR TaxID=2495594 RepID=UPI00143EFEAD|nr:SPOR domain-containing protein [Geobacter sp. SVR]BCS52922.1 SPOR domain-containing protein [Geobacter sp. SVR]GCF84306.1 SPOR domain-containing protein [Geobacter sp. SVR]
MRIDYSEPKQSYIGGHGKVRPRKEPVRPITTVTVVIAVVTFIAGYGTGWFFSQKAAKKSFQAAMEQTSLENSPKAPATPVQAVKTAQQALSPEAASHQGQAGGQQSAPAPQAAPEPNLSFYKTLPSGQKSNVLGSGINAGDDKGKKPLQAAIPSNLKQVQSDAEAPAAPPEKSATSEKPAARVRDNNGFVVQVASYTLKSEAESLRSKLAGKGLNVTIVESNQGDKGTWYRVQVGRKLEQDAAKDLAGKLGKGAIVIPDHN